jgi:hypothetical protein
MIMKTEYRKFFYWQDSRGSWWIQFPYGFKTVVPDAKVELDVKGAIDEIIRTR